MSKLDPSGSSLVYSTYLPRSWIPDYSGLFAPQHPAIAVDGGGNAIVAGGGFAAMVAKLNSTGTALVYERDFDGSGTDEATSIAVDQSGNAYVGGYTKSQDFPTTPGSYAPNYSGCQPSGNCAYDAFVAKVAPDGGVVYSTYLGGLGGDAVKGIAVDDAGNAYTTGATNSGAYPTTPGAYDSSYSGCNGGCPFDAFATKLNQAGSGLVYSTYLPFSSGQDVAVDAGGNAYIGTSQLVKVNAAGTGLVYSKSIGAPIRAVEVDAHGSAFAAGGVSYLSTFNPTYNAFDRVLNDGACCETDAYLAKLGPTGAEVLYGTYLGGPEFDSATGIAVRDGVVYVTGSTEGGFPVTSGAYDTSHNGSDGESDAFVLKLTLPDGYARPKAATPSYFPLVLGLPAVRGSRRGPRALAELRVRATSRARTRDHQTVRLPDARHRRLERQAGRLREAAVRLRVLVGDRVHRRRRGRRRSLDLFTSDVFTKAPLDDYTGEVQASFSVQLTDKDNTPHPAGAGPGTTVSSFPVAFAAPCVATADTLEGSTCQATTAMDTLMPGAVKEKKRAIWELSAGSRSTTAAPTATPTPPGDNTLFADPGRLRSVAAAGRSGRLLS